LFIWSDDATNPLAGDFLYITNVQLELGDTATPFEHRSFGQELALCQRYFEKWGSDLNNMLYLGGGVGMAWEPNEVRIMLTYSEKRASPTISASGTLAWAASPTSSGTQTSFSFDAPRTRSALLFGSMATGGSFTQSAALQVTTSAPFNLTISAEL
jgi:hypothetical protein